jgi:phage terminase small subunit
MTNLPELENTDRLGPAMLELNPRERAFVVALFMPDMTGTAAAKAAGFGVEGKSTNATFGRIAHRKLSQAHIVAAIEEESRRVVRSLAPSAVRALREILEDPKHRDRLKAARTVLERVDPSMMRFEHEHNVRVRATDHDSEAVAMLRQMRAQGATREVLEWFFGIGGLSRIEKKLAREEKGPLIEGEVIAPVGPNLGPNEHKTEPDAA